MLRTPPTSPVNTTTSVTAPSSSIQTQAHSIDTLSSTNTQNTMSQDRVTVKPIQFIKNDPEMYFVQMEAQFQLAGITRDVTKYNHILGTLDQSCLSSVRDLIRNPPAANEYDAIKERIIAEFQQSDQHKLRILLREIELGDLKLSQLLRKMRELSKNALSDDALKTLWLERLPEQIRPVISISEGNLNKIAIMADKMLEITSYNAISEVATHANVNPHALQMATLTQEVKELS